MYIFQMSVKLTPTVATLAKSVMEVNVNARMVGLYMMESASQVGFNPRVTNGLPYPYHLDESIFIFWDVRSNFSF